MAIRITNDTMTPETGNRVVATARFSEHAAADGNGAWIVSTCPARLCRQQSSIERPGQGAGQRGRAICGQVQQHRRG